MDRTVTLIEPEITKIYFGADDALIKKRVAAYVRVSTDSEEQKTSYTAQKEYYTEKIDKNPEWKFVSIYADEGTSGTQTKNRKQFNLMIDDSKAGEIDLILTKSISRFARNTVDALTYIRELRAIGVEVFFEKENLYSFDSKVDFMLTIMSSMAQEESRNISENIKWSFRKRFKEGKVFINTKMFLGYDKDESGNLIIDETQAKTVKVIYDLFLDGISFKGIADKLIELKMKTPTGKDMWRANSIKRILTNEKYKGDALLQKTVTLDYLTHKRSTNDNIEPQYYVKNNHVAIIDEETFDLVQTFIEQKETRYKHQKQDIIPHNKYPFSGIVFCAHCKRPMRRRHWNKGQPSEKVMLVCGSTKEQKGSCNAKAFEYNILEETSSSMMTNIINHKSEIFPNLITALNKSLDSENISHQIKVEELELNNIKDKIDRLIEIQIEYKNVNNIGFKEKYNKYIEELNIKQEEVNNFKTLKLKNRQSETRISTIKRYLDKNEYFPKKIDTLSFRSLISKIIILDPKNIIFVIESTNQTSRDEFVIKIDNLISKNPIKKELFTAETGSEVNYRIVKS